MQLALKENFRNQNTMIQYSKKKVIFSRLEEKLETTILKIPGRRLKDVYQLCAEKYSTSQTRKKKAQRRYCPLGCIIIKMLATNQEKSLYSRQKKR